MKFVVLSLLLLTIEVDIIKSTKRNPWDDLYQSVMRQSPRKATPVPSRTCSDPNTLPCPESYPFRCIKKSYFCDNDPDCPNGADEVGCVITTCPSGKRKCSPESRQCIYESFWCDGDRDCNDGEDEKNCTIPAAAGNNVTISKPGFLSIVISNPNQTVTNGSTFTLSCQVSGSKIDSIEWYHVDHGGFVLSANKTKYINSSRYTLDSPEMPTSQQPVSYELTIKNATFEDTGVFGCRARVANLSSIKHAIVNMPGGPDEVPATPGTSLFKTASSKSCCRERVQSDECNELLCTSSNADLWAMEKSPGLTKCLRYISDGLQCMADGQNSMPCCIRSDVSKKCQKLCQNQSVSDFAALALDCADEWSKLATCFFRTNQRKVDPPFGVTARALNSSSAEVSWLVTNEIYHTVRFAVYYTEINSTRTKLSELQTQLDNFTQGSNPLYKRLDSTSETSVIVTKLEPMTRYAFFVVTISWAGSVSSPSAIVEAITSSNLTQNEEKELGTKQCCDDNKVDDYCADLFCTLNHTVSTLQSVIESGVNCSSDMPKMLSCMAGMYDHSKCCQLRHVPEKCLKFCVGGDSQASKYDSLSHDDYFCLPYLNAMASCFSESKLPRPPESLRVTFQSKSPSAAYYPSIAVKVEWRRPKNYSGKVTRYLLSLTHLSTAKLSRIHVSGSLNSYTLMQPFVTIQFDKMYYLQLAAESEVGYSLDVETAFRTPKRTDRNSRQSSVTDSMRSCCKEERMSRACQSYCSADIAKTGSRSIYGFRGSKRRCFNDNWPVYAECSALGNDISDCCVSVPKRCKKFCRTGGKMRFSRLDKARCKNYVKSIFTCTMKKWPVETSAIPNIDKTMVPSPPKLLTVTSNWRKPSIAVRWSPPRSGSAFSNYVVAFKAGDDGQDEEISVEPSTTFVVLSDLTANVRYWVKVFTETHLGVRSKPSTTKSTITRNILYALSKTVKITGIDDCCQGLHAAESCMPLCTGVLGYLEDPSEITTRCPSDIAQISRCSVLALDLQASYLNRSVSLTSCCQSHGITNDECCSIPGSSDRLGGLKSCDNATSLGNIRSCVLEQLKEVGPTVIRDLTALNVTATRASLTWLAPEFNSDKVEKYKIQCQYADRNVAYSDILGSIWSDLIDTTTQSSETTFTFGEVQAGTRTRCSVWVDGFEATKAEILFESENVNMKQLELKLNDPDSTFLGSPAEFQCITGEFEYSSITWLKAPFGKIFDRKMLPDTFVAVNSKTLKISRLEKNHSGIYTCKLTPSSSQQAPVYLSTDLKVRFKPEKVPTNLEFLPCGFSGFPDRIVIMKETEYNNTKKISKRLPSKGFYVTNMTTIPADNLMQSQTFEVGVKSITLKVIASNVKGSAICLVPFNNPNATIEITPGWTSVEKLCQLVDQDECCMLTEENCPNICSLAKDCAVNVPIDCLSGFRQCTKHRSLIPPDLTGRIATVVSLINATDNPFKDTSVTKVHVSWRDSRPSKYPFKANYLVEYESMFDPLGPYVSSVEAGDIVLRVPRSDYTFKFFSMNQIGQTSRVNATETVTSFKFSGVYLSLFPGRRPVTSKNASPMLHFFWHSGMCIHFDWCQYTFLYVRPILRSNETDSITAIGGFKEYQYGYRLHNAYFIDPYPDDELIALVCIGNSKQSCTYSVPQFIKVLTDEQVKVARARADNPPDSDAKTSTSVIGLSIILGFVVIASIAFIGYCYGSRIIHSVSSRLGHPFVMYQRAAPHELDSRAIIMEDEVGNDDI